MTNKTHFTPEEWTKVLESIMAAGLAVSAVDPSGWWGTLKEAAASTPALAAAQHDPNSNELIKAAVADFERSSDGSILAMRERFAQAEPTECVQRSLTSLRDVSAIVDAKAPDEAAAFKAWLRQISQKLPLSSPFLALVESELAMRRKQHFATSPRLSASRPTLRTELTQDRDTLAKP